MSNYQLKTPKQAKAIIGAYQKIEDRFVDAFLEEREEKTPAEGSPSAEGKQCRS